MTQEFPRCPACSCAIHEGGPCRTIYNCYPDPDDPGPHRCLCDRTHPTVAEMIKVARDVYSIELVNYGGLTSKMNWARKMDEDIEEMRRKSAGDDVKMLRFYGLKPRE